MTAAELFACLPLHRPRHIYFPSDLPELYSKHQLEFKKLRVNLEMALTDGVTDEPQGAYRANIDRARTKLDRDTVACALMYLFESNLAAGEYAKRQLLKICDWQCSVNSPFDEVGLSVCRIMPAVFDWTFNLYSDEEKSLIAATLFRHAEEIEIRIKHECFALNPGNSHTARLPGYLGEIAMVLHGLADTCKLEAWLDYAVGFYNADFPFYGDDAGGWAEGVFYGSSYTKWFLPFFAAVGRAKGHSFFNKDFYNNVSEFFVHFAPPGQEVHPFGDGHWPTGSEWPGFQAQDPFSVYANSPLSKRFSRELREDAPFFELHLLDLVLPESVFPLLPRESQNSFCAKKSGMISMRRSVDDPPADVALLARCGRYGSQSHRHADQGNFAILAGGKAMISPSGYFGLQYGTEHHQQWTTQTLAQNCALINGKGQIKGSEDDVGEIVEFWDDGETCVVVMNLFEAYRTDYLRRIEFNRKKLIITVIDNIANIAPFELEWRLHSYVEPQKSGRCLRIEREKFAMNFEVSPPGLFSICNQFSPPCPGEKTQYHLSWKFSGKQAYEITARFNVELI